MTAASWSLGRGSRLALLQTCAGLGGRVFGRRGLIGRLPPPLSRWTDARDLPAPPRESFRRWWARTDAGRRGAGSQPDSTGNERGRK
jgi:L-lactate dehydrogenase complex protein LldF